MFKIINFALVCLQPFHGMALLYHYEVQSYSITVFLDISQEALAFATGFIAARNTAELKNSSTTGEP